VNLSKQRTWEILEVSKANDKISRYCDMFIIALIVLNVTAVVFDSVHSIHDEYGAALFAFETFSVLVFTLEYIARIWSSTSDARFTSPLKGRVRFALTPMAIIDLCAILPYWLPLFGIDLRVLWLLRIFRLLRLLKLVRYVRALQILKHVIVDKKEELMLSMVMLFLLVLISASIMYYAEFEAQPENFPDIPSTMWWAVITLTTVGYGDVYPITAMGQFFAAVIAILGIGMVALPTGIISSGYIEYIKNKNSDNKITCPHCKKTFEHDESD
jgi:voltage-gated potassium channel